MSVKRRTTSHRTVVTESEPRSVASRRLTVEMPLAPTFSRQVGAVARSRVSAAVPEADTHERATIGMPSPDIVRVTIAQRWRSDRPFQGMTTDAILHKLSVGALAAKPRGHAIAELARRGHRFGS